MADKLVVAVLGTRNSGKSRTWNSLFGADEEGGTVRTGKNERHLYLNAADWVDVFLVSGSAEERQVFIGKIVPKQLPNIVLCSMQYREDVMETLDFFAEHRYDIFVVWLNPGYHDEHRYDDDLDVIQRLLRKGACIIQRSGKDDPGSRCREIKQLIYGWARFRNMVTTDFA